ncbi:MAG: type II toxin-antitoxin system HicA family toxin [Fimbriimonadaceae bacterium]|nr:type II toxin-antitoxin system HicA family toxin [Fimbriimonadaceae bacterium]
MHREAGKWLEDILREGGNALEFLEDKSEADYLEDEGLRAMVSGASLRKVLEKVGFEFQRQRGSHVVMRRADPPSRGRRLLCSSTRRSRSVLT